MCTYNTITSHTYHFEIQKKGFRRKSIDFCKSVSQIIFANSLDLDQARQNVGPDLDPNCLIL